MNKTTTLNTTLRTWQEPDVSTVFSVSLSVVFSVSDVSDVSRQSCMAAQRSEGIERHRAKLKGSMSRSSSSRCT